MTITGTFRNYAYRDSNSKLISVSANFVVPCDNEVINDPNGILTATHTMDGTFPKAYWAAFTTPTPGCSVEYSILKVNEPISSSFSVLTGGTATITELDVMNHRGTWVFRVIGSLVPKGPAEKTLTG